MPTQSLRHRSALQALALLLLPAVALLASCTIRLIADYDEHTFARTTELQEQCESLFVALEEAAKTADTQDDLYDAHDEQYLELISSLRALETRAQTIDKNEIPADQIGLLRDSFEKMQDTHRERSAQSPPKGFSLETLKVLREPVVQQFRSILTLQEALKR